MPPRILEKFTPKKVKKGSSITFSVKVEGGVTHGQDDSYPRCSLPGGGPGSWWGSVTIRDELTALCPSGHPAPSVHWLKEEAEKGVLWIGPDTPGYTMASSSKQHSLVLLDVGRQHQGTYTCIATNAAGQALCSASLHISGCE